MYISETKLRKLIRQQLFKENAFTDAVQTAIEIHPVVLGAKKSYDFYYDTVVPTLTGDSDDVIEVGRLPWETSHTDIIKLPYGGVCFLGPDEKNAVPATLIGKMSKENNFIVLVDPKANIPAKHEGWFREKRRNSSHEKYVWNAMKKLKPDITNNAWTKAGGIKDQLAKGNVYYAASTKFLYYPLSSDEKAGISQYMRNTGIEVASNSLGIASVIISPINAPAAAGLDILGNAFGIADVLNKLEDKDYYSVAWGLIGLIPGGDVLNVFSKLKNDIAIAAPIADELADFLLGLIGSEYDSVFATLMKHYLGDDADKDLSDEELASFTPITNTILKIATDMYEGVSKKLKEEGKEEEAKKYTAKATKAAAIDAVAATKKVAAKI